VIKVYKRIGKEMFSRCIVSGNALILYYKMAKPYSMHVMYICTYVLTV
jgi:hypothetical protein